MRGGSTKCPVIGLLGAMGSGKSAIAGIFRGFGAVTVDADDISRKVLDRPGIISRISSSFGQSVLEGGRVSRAALADAVFADGAKLAKLNSIVHPEVIAETVEIIGRARKDPSCRAVVLDAPLLIEAGLDGLCDHMVFVDAARDLRQGRLAASRAWGEGEISRREKFQDSLISKRQRADYIVDNNGSLEETIRQVTAIWDALVDT